MSLRDLIDKALFYISVPKCVGCGERLKYESFALCEKCYESFLEASSRNCSRCSRVLSRCDCSMEYLEKHRVKRVIKLFRYLQREENRAANSLIYSLKRDNRKDVLEFCANRLAEAILYNVDSTEGTVVTSVPRRRRTILKYGIDHARLLGEQVAGRIGAEYKSLLVSEARVEQKMLHGEERRVNAKYSIKHREDLKGKIVFIVDDVITTGASVGAAADLIRQMGAKEIIAASIGITYKDKYEMPVTHFDKL